jgi:hypothetical protein
MKFVCSVDIDRPLDEVVEFFDNVENLEKWQDGFVSAEHLSGTAGEVGARSRVIYRIGKRQIELIETITVKNLPDEFAGTYEADAMTNTMTNRFSSIDENRARWEAEIEYTQFN